MELLKINNGLYDNDPNADNLRTGADKINDNFDILEDLVPKIGTDIFLGYAADGEVVDTFTVAARMNARRVTITDKQCPVLITMYSSLIWEGDYYYSTMSYTFLFKAGSGKWGINGSAVSSVMFSQFAPLRLTAEDLAANQSVKIEPLGVIPEGQTYLDMANASNWNWSDSGTETETGVKQYYFSYSVDGELILAFFDGVPGSYGPATVPFTADMFKESKPATTAEKTKLSEFENDVPFAEINNPDFLGIVDISERLYVVDGTVDISTIDQTTTPTVLSTRPVILIAKTINDNSSVSNHGVSDNMVISKPINGWAYNSIDAFPHFLGQANYDHYAGHQARPWIEIGLGVITDVRGFSSAPKITSGTVTRLHHNRVYDATGLGTVLENIGLLVNSLTKGSINWAIYTLGATQSLFEGNVNLSGKNGLPNTPQNILRFVSGAANTPMAAMYHQFANSSTGSLHLSVRTTTTAGDAGLTEMVFLRGGSSPLLTIYCKVSVPDGTDVSHAVNLGQLNTAATNVANNYVPKSGAVSKTGTMTFTDAPIVPNATAAGHPVNKSQFDAKVADLETGFAIDNTFTGSSGWFSTLNTLYPNVRLGYTVYAIHTSASYACRKLSATQWAISPIEGIVTQA